jgi:putative MATE family efflux protein
MSRLRQFVRSVRSRLRRASGFVSTHTPNPIKFIIFWIGMGLAKAGLIDKDRAKKTTELAWPRIVTGIARMSKNAVDVAMVGVAVGTTAVAGVGFASPYWGLAFAVGGGISGGTIALVSQRFGADAYDDLGLAVRSSVVLVVIVSIPLTLAFWVFSDAFIAILSGNEGAIEFGSTYLQIVGLGIPFAALNLVGSRVLVGSDDAYTAMQIRAGGAVANIALNAVFIFGLGWGVAGAALGTVFSNIVVTSVFAIGLVAGRFPGVGEFPVQISPVGNYVDPSTLTDLVEIGFPVALRRLVWVTAEFPMLGILDIFGENTVAAWVIARRLYGLMNAPGWGFGLASSSLVGQELGQDNEAEAEAYGRDIIRFSVATYLVSALLVAVFAQQVVALFASSPSSPEVPIAISLVYAACIAVVFQGVSSASAGPLDASGDTRIPFASQFLGMYVISLPLAYLGAAGLDVASTTIPLLGVSTPALTIPALGLWGLYLAFVAEAAVPAAINYWRFRTDKWKAISEAYRPETAVADD